MLFNSMVFVAFLAIVLVGHWTLTSRRARNLFLLAASYVFYGWWDWRFLILLFATSTIDYFVAIGIHDSTDERRRKILVSLSIATNVGSLIVFKYLDFFADNLRLALEVIGLHLTWPVLRILVPVGVSFYTLQAMAYTVDVYRRTAPPCRDYPDYLLFLAYFPQLIAGPISRVRQLLPQIQADRRFDPQLASEAIPYIAIGYVLKSVVADNMASVANLALATPKAHSGLELLIAGFCTLFELYGDLAGYTYIALGVSMLFGIRLPQNFRSPFLAQSPSDFWTRWHISLTTWFRDYFFFPLVGRKRPSRMRIRLALLITFVVSGLWHRASWTCVIWGLLHTLCYALPAPFSQRTRVGRAVNSAVMLTVLLIPWLFLSVPSASDAYAVARRILTAFWPSPGVGGPQLSEISHLYAGPAVLAMCVLGLEVVQRRAEDLPQIARWPTPARYAFYATLATAYFYVGNFSRIPFIYFRF